MTVPGRAARGSAVALVLGLVCAGAAAPAEAQSREPARPYSALFGGSGDGTHTLDLTVSLLAAHDDNLLAADQGGGAARLLDPQLRRSGFLSTAQGILSYRRQGQRLSVFGTAASGVSHFPELERTPVTEQYRGGFNLAFQPWRRGRWSMSPTVDYSTRDRLRLFRAASPEAEEPSAIETDYAFLQRKSVRYSFNTSLSHELSARSSLAVDYGFHHVDFADDQRHFRVNRAGVRFSRQMTRYASLRLGYGHQLAEYGAIEGVEPRDPRHLGTVDLGIDYARPLSVSRRTTFSFGSGSQILRREEHGQEDRDPLTRIRMTGFASLSHEMGRSWNAALLYQRGFGLVPGVYEPVFSDSATASLSGHLTRRLATGVSAHYSSGSLGSVRRRRDFDTYTGIAFLRFSVSRYVALTSSYVYYRYHFNDLSALPEGMPSELDRRGVRVGLMMWIPLRR